MPDPRFFLTRAPIAAAEAAIIAGATLDRDGDSLIRRAASLEDDDLADAVVFAETSAKAKSLSGRKFALCLAPAAYAEHLRSGGPVAAQERPRLGFARIAARLHEPRPFDEEAGVHPSAKIEADARIHPTAVVAAKAEIGPRAMIGPHAAIGPGVVIGPDADIGSSATIVCAILGARVIVLAGARIGQPGFGVIPTPEGLFRIPQLGRVLVGDDVEIGANSTIDRGALGDTVIGEGAKIDNLVQIGHNVRIGRHAALAAQVGVSGSTIVGERVMMGGQAGLADHLTIGAGAQIAARSGLMHDVPAGEKWGGTPARPVKVWFREVATLAKLAARKKAGGHGED